jgi:hypothetical protein
VVASADVGRHCLELLKLSGHCGAAEADGLSFTARFCRSDSASRYRHFITHRRYQLALDSLQLLVEVFASLAISATADLLLDL